MKSSDTIAAENELCSIVATADDHGPRRAVVGDLDEQTGHCDHICALAQTAEE